MTNRGIRRRTLLAAAGGAQALLLPGAARAQMMQYNLELQQARTMLAIGSLDDALRSAKAAERIAEVSFGAKSTWFQNSSLLVASVEAAQGQYESARRRVVRAQSLDAEPDPRLQSQRGFAPLSSGAPPAERQVLLAEIHTNLGNFQDAKAIYTSLLAPGSAKEHRLTASNALAKLLIIEGKAREAEALVAEGLKTATNDQALERADGVEVLAMLTRGRGQLAEARRLQAQVIALRTSQLKADHPYVTRGEVQLGEMELEAGDAAAAARRLGAALKMQEWHLGKQHPTIATTLLALALALEATRSPDDLEPLLRRAVAIRQQRLGPRHLETARARLRLYEFQLRTRPPSGLVDDLDDCLKVLRAALKPNAREMLAGLDLVAKAHTLGDRIPQAAHYQREFMNVLVQRLEEDGYCDSTIAIIEGFRDAANRYFAVLQASYTVQPEATLQEMFRVRQLYEVSKTTGAISAMAARFSSPDRQLSELISQQNAVGERVEQLRRDVSRIHGDFHPGNQAQALATAHAAMDAAVREYDAVAARIAAAYPKYRELSRPSLASRQDVQAVLRPSEVLLAFTFPVGPGARGHLLVVTPREMQQFTLDIDHPTLARHAARLRSQMGFDDGGKPLALDLPLLHELFGRLLGPVASRLLDTPSDILVVPDGPMNGFPLGALITAPPPPTASYINYTRTKWLGLQRSITVIPSIGSLRLFRADATRSRAPQPFAGFGDPIIGQADDPAPDEQRRRNWVSSLPPKTRQGPQRAGFVADVDLLRQAPRLRETADELKQIASTLGADDGSLWIGDRATETNLKRIDLARYQTLVFATHGLMANELDGIDEPGLILTPPARGTADDDGYLSASEIARLRLDAEWVVLSACNTGSPDGESDAQLGSLARAFFHAGGRAMLVSHWPVASTTTAQLVTSLFKFHRADARAGRSGAYLRAARELAGMQRTPQYAHPMYWAAFSVVGDAW